MNMSLIRMKHWLKALMHGEVSVESSMEAKRNAGKEVGRVAKRLAKRVEDDNLNKLDYLKTLGMFQMAKHGPGVRALPDEMMHEAEGLMKQYSKFREAKTKEQRDGGGTH